MTDEVDLTAELQELRRDNARLRADVERLHRSLSWRLTSPLRDLANALRRRSLSGLAPPTRPASANQPIEATVRSRFEEEVVIFALLPAGQGGGGQRSAQLARAFARAGYRVRYFYAADSFNFAKGAVEALPTPPWLSVQCHISAVSVAGAFRALRAGSTVIFEAPHPRFSPYLEAAREAGLSTVYELIDDWDTSLGADWFDPALHERFIARSEQVTGTARVLHRTLVERHGRADAVYLPNAADEVIFRPRAGTARPPEFVDGKRALVYVGTLSGEWLSWEHLAAAGSIPDAQVYLIGDLPYQQKLPHGVVGLGVRDVASLPNYLAHADAALVPFKIGRLVDAVSPIKAFEYLFMGCAVVATPLPELEGLPGVSFGGTPAEFAAACARAKRPTEPERQDFLMRNNWSARADALISLSAPRKRIDWLVVDRGDASRCEASLREHSEASSVSVVCDERKIHDAIAATSAEVIGMIDSRCRVLAGSLARQAMHAFEVEGGSVGLVSTAPGALMFWRRRAVGTLTMKVTADGVAINGGDERVVPVELPALDAPTRGCIGVGR